MNYMNYSPKGDKKNSDFFNEYVPKIYKRRRSSGLDDMLGNMKAIVVQVETNDGLGYLKELYLMTPYRFVCGYINNTHKIYILRNQVVDDVPVYIVLEPMSNTYTDSFTRMGHMYPNSRSKPNARYVGELFATADLKQTLSTLESHDFNFCQGADGVNGFYCNQHFAFTTPSDHSFNVLGYTEHDFMDLESLHLGQRFMLTKAQLKDLEEADEFVHKTGIASLIRGIDHCATRILAPEREDAILELLCLTPYYFWGAYNISDMNSSTNVNRVPHGHDIKSPAKVFTANNTPYMVNSFEGLPMPTETFVRNYGRRMHHVAYEILDGEHASGVKNIDFFVSTLKDEAHLPFLAKVFGGLTDGPDLKQIFSKHSFFSLLITEYVQRIDGFDGFFTKDNVAALTEAAGQDEMLSKHVKNQGTVFD